MQNRLLSLLLLSSIAIIVNIASTRAITVELGPAPSKEEVSKYVNNARTALSAPIGGIVTHAIAGDYTAMTDSIMKTVQTAKESKEKAKIKLPVKIDDPERQSFPGSNAPQDPGRFPGTSDAHDPNRSQDSFRSQEMNRPQDPNRVGGPPNRPQEPNRSHDFDRSAPSHDMGRDDRPWKKNFIIHRRATKISKKKVQVKSHA